MPNILNRLDKEKRIKQEIFKKKDSLEIQLEEIQSKLRKLER